MSTATANDGFTTLVATRVYADAGKTLFTGTLEVLSTDGNDCPFAATAGGSLGGPIGTNPAIFTITNGAIVGTQLLADTALTLPPNISYRFTFKNPDGSEAFAFRGVQFRTDGVATPSFSLDGYQQAASVAAPSTPGESGQGYNYTGAWQANHAYVPYDQFTQGGSTYNVVTAYTSGGAYGAADEAAAALFAAAGDVSSGQLASSINSALTSGLTATEGAMGTTAVSQTGGGSAYLTKYAGILSGPVAGFEIDVASFTAGDTASFTVARYLQTTSGQDQLQIITNVVVPIKSTGINSYVVGTDFTAFNIAAGDYFGPGTYGTATLNYGTDGAFGNGIYTISDKRTVGTVFFAQYFATNYMHCLVSVVSTPPPVNANQVATQIAAELAAGPYVTASQVPGLVGAGFAPSPRTRTVLWTENFAGSAPPANWATVNAYELGAAGCFTVSNGLVSPVTPAAEYTSIINFSQYYAIDQRTTRIVFEFLGSGSVMGCGFNDFNSDNQRSGGTLFVVDSRSQQLTVNAPASASSGSWSFTYPTSHAPTNTIAVSIPFTLVAGTRYTLTLTKDHGINSATLTDPLTAASVTVSSGDNAAGSVTQYSEQVDFLSFVAVGGVSAQFKVHSVQILANYRKPRVLLIGDSRTYGYTQARPDTWAYQLAQHLPPGAVALSGRTGATSLGICARVATEAAYLLPDICFLGAGANDAGILGLSPTTQQISDMVSAFVANMQPAINALVAAGALVVVDVPPPTPSYYTAEAWTALKTAILALTGVTAFLYSNVALTVGNGGVTQDTTLFGGDHLHYNAAGATDELARFLADVEFVKD